MGASMGANSKPVVRIAFAGLICAVVAACGGGDRREPAPVVYRNAPSGSGQLAPAPAPSPEIQSAAAPVTAPAPVPSGQADGRGVVYYDGYETIRARRGDGVADMAARVGMTGAELAAYNGLSTQYAPQEGDELVLPARADRYQGTITAPAPQPVAVASTPQSASSFPSVYAPSVSAPEDQTASAPPQPVQPAPAAETGSTGWSADLARAAITGGDATAQAPAPAPQQGAARASIPAEPLPPAEPRLVSPAADPAPAPVERAPQPQAPEIASVTPEPAAPAPASVSSSARFIKPTTAPIALPFSRAAGPGRNDGVDFATRAGDPVAAADNGTVALISKSLGGLGTIVLVRHEDEFLTVYGRVDNVTVRKGDRVSRGQVIAQVADLTAPRNPYLHFEVRRGAESVDPQQYF